MISIYICLGVIALLVGISLKARRHFTPQERIPMQWNMKGEINWSARRDIAIWIIPAIGLGTLIFMLWIFAISDILNHILGCSILGFTGLMLVIIHQVHMRYARHYNDRHNSD